MRLRFTNQLTPTRFLALINVFASGLAFARGVIVARGLTPELLGVIAVISGINTMLLNFLDVRLTDLASKLYYQTKGLDAAAQRAYRASVLVLCMAGTTLISLVLGGAGVLTASLLIGVFTDAPVAGWWLVAQAAVLGSANISNTFDFLQRFSGRFYFFGTVRLIIRSVALVLFVLIFEWVKAINGYYLGAFLSGLFMLVFTGLVTGYMWVRQERLPIFSRQIGRALPDYRRHLRFLFYGNLLGYIKLLHRAADTLIVGYLADDRTTGLYKFVRSLTDSLYIFFDAMNQVYQPRLLELLAASGRRQYRALAVRIMAVCALFTVVAVGAEAVLLRPLLSLVFGDKYLGAENAIMLMTVPFVFVAGIYTWLWPTFIHSGRLGWFTAANGLAAVAQYVVLASLFAFAGSSPTMAAASYLAFYLVLYPLAYMVAKRRYAAYLPGEASR